MSPLPITMAACCLMLVACGNSSSYGGSCRKLGRPLTDQEFIRAALSYKINSRALDVKDTPPSIDDFVAKNPNCCSVDRNPDSEDWLIRLTDVTHVAVEVNFRVSSERSGSIGSHYKGRLFIDSCGEVLDQEGAGYSPIE